MTILLKSTGARFLAADRVWIATALLHREHPEREDFSEAEILERGRREEFVEERAKTFAIHVNQHCVANRPPNPGTHRMLMETAKGRRRLYRQGDPPCRVDRVELGQNPKISRRNTTFCWSGTSNGARPIPPQAQPRPHGRWIRCSRSGAQGGSYGKTSTPTSMSGGYARTGNEPVYLSL
jgi:hypothetical protein